MQSIKELFKKEKNDQSLINVENLKIDYLDQEKISFFTRDISKGINNFILFQKFYSYKWPYWLFDSITIQSNSFKPISPFHLLNNTNRNWISFSNKYSSKRVLVDPSGMVSFPNDPWSIEFWIIEKNILYRPQERVGSVAQSRDIDTFIITNKWQEKNYKIVESVYGLKSELEEAVIEINCISRVANVSHSLLIVMRPYNTESLGGVYSVDFNKKSGLIRVNGCDRIYTEKRPDFMITGNGTKGDIIQSDLYENAEETKCKYGMAALALGYKFNEGNTHFKFRISLSNERNFDPVKINISKSKEDYIKYTNFCLTKGFKITFPDRLFQNWVHGSKISALNFFDDSIEKAIEAYGAGFKSLYYIISGYNRMGYFVESVKILDSMISKYSYRDKLSFPNVTDGCYISNSIADYFKISRDIDYLKLKYKRLRAIAATLYKYSKQIKGNKKANNRNKNSIDSYIILEPHIFDIILLAYTLNQISYLARCLGIFNDEIIFNKESTRLESIIINEINGLSDIENDEKNTDAIKEKNEHDFYNVFAGYPFNINKLPLDNLKVITNKIMDFFDENPFYFKSVGGSDTFFSIIFAINLLLVKDIRIHKFVDKLIEFGKERYALPDFVNPKTGFGVMGEGDSVTVISTFFILLRSLIFLDTQERLEIFPVPRVEWFSNGSEIRIEDAPSIFGALNFSVFSSKSEIQFHFHDLPKFIPPDMMINLPFKTKIKKEDDFIIKKESGNSYLIHGWPSIVRFSRN